MNKFLGLAVLAAALLGGGSAQGTTYNFSYTYESGDAVTGSFDGAASGNLITNLSHISVQFNGVDFVGSGSLFSKTFDFEERAFVPGGIMSFDGRENNFYFSDIPSWDPSTNLFFMAPFGFGRAVAVETRPQGGLQLEVISAAQELRWQLSAVTAVPEPESYAMMLAGLGLVGAFARRRMQA